MHPLGALSLGDDVSLHVVHEYTACLHGCACLLRCTALSLCRPRHDDLLAMFRGSVLVFVALRGGV